MRIVNCDLILRQVCDEINRVQPEFIAVDTEFMRNRKTYFPLLCLIQIAYGDQCVIVDALSPDLDLSPLTEIFSNPSIVKVFHDCRQDIEALLTVLKEAPVSIFDTQIAAMFCDYYDNFVGYGFLVWRLCGVSLNKLSFKRVDWSLRPLTDNQIVYAANDVTYLQDIYKLLRNELKAQERFLWFVEEMLKLENSELYRFNPSSLAGKLQVPGNWSCEKNIVFLSLNEWREILAQHFNVGRELVINNQALINLVGLINPASLETLNLHKYINKRFSENMPVNFEQILHKNLLNNVQLKCYKHNINYNRDCLNILLFLLEDRCRNNEISSKLVACNYDLVQLIIGEFDKSKLNKGWRYDFIGNKIISFLEGSNDLSLSAQRLITGDIKIKIA